MAELQVDIEGLVRGFSGAAGVAARNLATGEAVAVNATTSFPTASMIKILVLYQLLREVERGNAQLWERLTLRAADRTRGSGLLSDCDEGLNPTVRDLAVLMMAISDNTATNMLIDRLGVHAINQAMQEAGMRNSQLRGRIDFDRIRADPGNLAVATPRDFCDFLSSLHRGELLSGGSVEQMLRIMRIQKYIEPLRRHLPYDPYGEEFGEPQAISVASKTGSLSGIRGEAGLVQTPAATYSIAVMSKDGKDRAGTSENEGLRLIASVSRRVYEAWGGVG
jgi:beta-lactamase class A